jgi:hypothetical protein
MTTVIYLKPTKQQQQVEPELTLPITPKVIDELVRWSREITMLQRHKCPGCLGVRRGMRGRSSRYAHFLTCNNKKCGRRYKVDALGHVTEAQLWPREL